MAAVETIARLAVVHRVDAVLVAGDVFDAQTVADRTIRKLFNARQGFPEPRIMIPGNHVAALTESVWTRAARLDAVPAKLHRALQGMVLDFPALGVSALTAPLTQRHIYTDLTEWFDEAPTAPGHVRSGVSHGGVQGVLAKDIEAANPNRAEWAACAKLGRPTQIILGDALVQSDDHRLEKVKRAHLRCAPDSTRRRCLPVIWAPDAAWAPRPEPSDCSPPNQPAECSVCLSIPPMSQSSIQLPSIRLVAGDRTSLSNLRKAETRAEVPHVFISIC